MRSNSEQASTTRPRRGIQWWLPAVFIALALAVVYMTQVRPKLVARGTTEAIYTRLMQRDYAGLKDHAPPYVIDQFRQLERDHGPVRSYKIKDVMVQILGTPWGVDVEVARDTTALELLGGSNSSVESLQRVETNTR